MLANKKKRFCIPSKAKATSSEIVNSAMQFRAWSRTKHTCHDGQHVKACGRDEDGSSHLLRPCCVPGSVPSCTWFTSLDPPTLLQVGTMSRYYSCFLFYRCGNWGPKRQRWDLNSNQFSELVSTILNSLAMICWCGPTGSKMEWGSASWVLVLQLPSSCESGSFIWPSEPPCLTLSSGDNTTCPIYFPGYGEGLPPGVSAEEHRKLWNALSTQVGE